MKKVFLAKNAAAPAGPCSPAVEANGFVFLSGQIPVNADGSVDAGGISEQAEKVFENIKAVLQDAGLDLTDVVKVTVYATDLSDFAALNEVYAKHFSAPFPARATVQVAGLPKGVALEMDAVAARKA